MTPPSAVSLVVALAFGLGARVAGADPTSDPAWGAFADSLVTSSLARHHVPGAVLVVVRDGRVAFAKGYGLADVERRVPVDPERTAFRVASVSKLFTATAAMQLVEQGRLDLDADVNRTLQRFQVSATYPRPVTLFDLLTHTAGFDDANIARKAHRAADVEPLGDYLARRLPARVRPPGEFIAYSNHGMALAGYLVEVASGLPFERYVKERVFTPLGMSHSTFALEPAAGAEPAAGYDGDPPRRQAPDYTRTIPASMLSTTGADVARFMIAHLEGDSLMLGRESLAAMHRRQFSQRPELSGIGFGFWERTLNSERVLWHDGDASGFASLLVLVPARHLGCFMAFNSRGGNRARREILAALFDREFPRSHPPVAPGARVDLGPLAGTYVDMRHGHSTLEKLVSFDRTLQAGPGAGDTLDVGGVRYVPLAGGIFRTANGDGRLAFGRDRSGRVTHMFESAAIARVYERVPWYETPGVQLAWLLLCVVAFAWSGLGALIGRLWRRGGAVQPVSWAGRTAVIAVTLDLLFLVGMAVALAGGFGSLEYGIPIMLPVLLTVPLVTTTLTAAALLGCRGAWRACGGAGSKARLVAALAGTIAFVPWLACWNLLGYHY